MEVKIDKILLYSLVGVLSIISLFIIKDFLIPLIFTLILVHILNPIYRRLKKYLKSHTLTSLSVITFFLLIFTVPIGYAIFELSSQMNSIDDSTIENRLSSVSTMFQEEYDVSIDFNRQYQNLVTTFEDNIDSMLSQFPILIFNLFLIVFFYYYFSKHYNHEIQFFRNIFGTRFTIISKKIEELIQGIIYGQIFVRFIQAIIAIIGFYIIGVPNAIVWGSLIFFAAFIPVIGSGLIWIPLSINAFFQGEQLLAVLILIIGTLVSFVDNLLLPFFISEKTNIGPVITLISIIGGLSLFGLYGILLGPFTLGFFLLLLHEVFVEIREKNPRLRHIIWTDDERKGYRKLKTEVERKKYIKMINKKYEDQMKR